MGPGEQESGNSHRPAAGRTIGPAGSVDVVAGEAGGRGSGKAPPGARPSIQIYFGCANAYLRVFRSVNGSGYQARCPRCGKDIRFAVGPGGTSQRFFTVSC